MEEQNLTLLQHIRRHSDEQTAVAQLIEYGIVMILVAIIIFVALIALGQEVGKVFSNVKSCLCL